MKLLHIDSAITGSNSVSRQLTAQVVAAWTAAHPGTQVEYLDLVAQQPLPGDTSLAFDIGTGTGVLAAVLARRGVSHIIATDMDTRALTCARANLMQLGLDSQVEVVKADLFPSGRASLIVCNPPWLPARPGSPIEHAVFDEGSQMLLGVGTLVAVALGALLAWTVTRSIVRPVQLGRQAAERIANGDLTCPIACDSRDETGQLLQALATMQSRLAAIVGNVRNSAEGVATASVEIAMAPMLIQ